jgi:hypothetical protein
MGEDHFAVACTAIRRLIAEAGGPPMNGTGRELYGISKLAQDGIKELVGRGARIDAVPEPPRYLEES